MANYLELLKNKINDIENNELDAIENGSNIIKDVYMKNGLVYVFGSGHSSILSTEVFYRPGGLLNIYPIFYAPLMVHKGPMTSSLLERDSKILKKFMGNYKITENDCLIVTSTSGINPVPIDIALEFKKKKAKVIAISSKYYYQKVNTRHESNKFLIDFADTIINNHIEQGDAVLKKENYHFGSLSTIVGCTIMNLLMTKSIAKIIDHNQNVDIIVSGNIPGGLEHNKKLVAKYSKRIKCLK